MRLSLPAPIGLPPTLRQRAHHRPPRADLERPERNWEQSPGAHLPERSGHTALLQEAELVDVWRELHPDKREFTHTSARYGGWRIDGLIVSRDLLDKMISSEIRHEVFREFPNASDHWPIVTELRGPL